MGKYWPARCTAERILRYNGPKGPFFQKIKGKSLIEITDIVKDNIRYDIGDSDKDMLYYLSDTEKKWIGKKRTIFVPKDIMDWIKRCSFDNFDFDIISKSLYGPTCFSFQKGYTYDGFEIRSFLINIDESFKDTGFFLSFFNNENRKHIDSCTSPCCVLLKAKSLNIIFGKLHGDCNKEYTARIKAALSVLFYVSTFPECLKNGPPSPDEKVSGSKQFTLTPPKDKRIIGEHGTPCAHWRRGHFRVLRGERFKRAEDGSARVVFVHDCIVAQKDQEIYHIED